MLILHNVNNLIMIQMISPVRSFVSTVQVVMHLTWNKIFRTKRISKGLRSTILEPSLLIQATERPCLSMLHSFGNCTTTKSVPTATSSRLCRLPLKIGIVLLFYLQVWGHEPVKAVPIARHYQWPSSLCWNTIKILDYWSYSGNKRGLK